MRQEELYGERELPEVLTQVSEIRLDAVSSPPDLTAQLARLVEHSQPLCASYAAELRRSSVFPEDIVEF